VLKFVGCTLSLLFITATAMAAESPLATVGGQAISTDQLDRAWQEKSGSQHVNDGQVAQVGEVMLELIQFELLYADASQSEYASKPEVAQAIRRLVVDYYMKDTLLPELAAIAVTDEDIEAYYQANTALFTLPPATHGALIQISVPATVSVDKKAALQTRAQAAHKQALLLADSVTDFGGVAVKYSDDQATRYRGGDVGWLNGQSHWDKQLLAEFGKLGTAGALSEVIETKDGFYVLKAVEVRSGSVQNLTVVREKIRHQLFRDKRQSVKDNFYASLSERVDVQFYQQRMDEWLEQAGTRVDAPPGKPD